MIITRYVSNLLFSNMYVIEENGHSVLIDPFEHIEVSLLKKPELMIVTHEHFDHISGVNYMKEKLNIPLLCSKRCAERILNPKLNLARYFESFSEMQNEEVIEHADAQIDRNYSCSAEFCFDEEIRFSWRGLKFWLFSLPGHSPGSIGISVNEEILFSGDSLFENCRTELRFPGGNRIDWMERSLPLLNSLPDETMVFPGHYEHFLLKDRKQNGFI